MHIVFQLYDALRFDSTVVINVFINITSPTLNNQIFFKFQSLERMNILLGNVNTRLNYFAVANSENL